MKRPVLFAVARVTLRIGESTGAEPHTKGTVRMPNNGFLGLDVHADTITVAVADPDKEVILCGGIPVTLHATQCGSASRISARRARPNHAWPVCYKPWYKTLQNPPKSVKM